MIDRVRGVADRALGGRDWWQLFYLTNTSLIVMAIAIYLFSLSVPGNVTPAVALLIGFALFFLAWYLLDGFGLLRQSPFLYHLYHTPGLRWLDGILAVLALIVLVGTWQIDRLNEPIAVIAGLTLVNGCLGFFQFHASYSEEALEAADNGGLTPTPVPAPEAEDLDQWEEEAAEAEEVSPDAG